MTERYRILSPTHFVPAHERVADTLPDSCRDLRAFAKACARESSVLYELGDFEGMLWFTNVMCGWRATVHLVIWGDRLRHRADDARAILEEIMETWNLQKVEAYIPSANVPAIRYAEKVGYSHEITLCGWDQYGGVATDIEVYVYRREK